MVLLINHNILYESDNFKSIHILKALLLYYIII